MINLKDITQAVETLLGTVTGAVTIQRNPMRNDDPSRAVDGWIGIYRGSVDYEPHATGKNWMALVDVLIEIQSASHDSGADAEDKLQDLEKQVIDILNDNPTLSGTVQIPLGYSIEYQYNADEESGISFHAAIITIHSGVRAS